MAAVMAAVTGGSGAPPTITGKRSARAAGDVPMWIATPTTNAAMKRTRIAIVRRTVLDGAGWGAAATPGNVIEELIGSLHRHDLAVDDRQREGDDQLVGRPDGVSRHGIRVHADPALARAAHVGHRGDLADA